MAYNYGIHTFELSQQLTSPVCEDLKSILYDLSRQLDKRAYKSTFYLYTENGITISFRQYSMIKIIINPSRLLNPDDIIGLYHSDTKTPVENITNIVHKYLQTFIYSDTILSGFRISRIDYTIDAHLPSNEHVLLMIKQAKKLGLPRGFQDTYPAKIRNSPDFNDKYSYDITHTDKAYGFTLYAKHLQLVEERKNIPPDILRQAEGLIRAEFSQKCIWELFSGPPEEIQELFSSDAVFSCFKNFLPRIFPHGKFVKSSQAKQVLQEHFHTERSLCRCLMQYLDIIIKTHNFWGSYKMLKNKNFTRKELLEKFYLCGINPVTIAVNEKISQLPDIYSLLNISNILKKCK